MKTAPEPWPFQWPLPLRRRGIKKLTGSGGNYRRQENDWLAASAGRGARRLPATIQLLDDTRLPIQLPVLTPATGPGANRYHDCLRREPRRIAFAYSMSDVLALPTPREKLPHFTPEAEVCAVPAVTTTATVAIDSVVDGVTAHLSLPYALSLVDSAHRMASDGVLRHRHDTGARKRINTQLDPATSVRQTMADARQADAIHNTGDWPESGLTRRDPRAGQDASRGTTNPSMPRGEALVAR